MPQVPRSLSDPPLQGVEGRSATCIYPAGPVPVVYELERNAWTYGLWWPHDRNRQELGLDIPVQTAPNHLGRYLYGAALMLVAALTAIVVAGQLDNAGQLTAAAFGGYFLFLVRQWSEIPRVHHLTAISGVYVVSGVLAAGWALGWGNGQKWIWFELVLIVPWLALLLICVPYFDSRGMPPRAFALPWHALSWLLERSRQWTRRRLSGSTPPP